MSGAIVTYDAVIRRPLAPFIKEWLLYAYSVVYPLFVFSVVTSRDSPSLWIVVLMLLVVIVDVFQTGGRIWTDRSFGILFAFLATYIVSTLIIFDTAPANTWLGRNPLDRAIATDLRLFNVILAFIAFVHFLADAPERVFQRVFRIQIYVGVAIAVFGILQYLAFNLFGSIALSGIEPTNESYKLRGSFLKLGAQRLFRASSIFNEPSYFGFLLVPLLVKALVAWREGLLIGSHTQHRSILIILVIAVIANFSFTAILSLVLLSIPIIVVSFRRSPRVVVLALAVGAIIVALLAISPLGPAVAERLNRVFEVRDASTIDRLVRVVTSTTVFVNNPLFGVGPGGYAFWYPRLGGLDISVMASPLNVWLCILTDVGIFGVLLFIFFLYSIFKRAMKYRNNHALITIYLWSAIAYLVLLTSLDFWFLDMFWFELAMLLTLTVGSSVRLPENVHGVGRYLTQ